jgi:protein-tyrosine-phosphatase
MAEVMAKHWLSQHSSPNISFSVGSAALSDSFEPPGSPASAHSIAVMAQRGLSLSVHRSRLINQEIVDKADFIYCVSSGHERRLRELYPSIRAQVFVFSHDIPDPWHQEKYVNEACAEKIWIEITQSLPVLMKRLVS